MKRLIAILLLLALPAALMAQDKHPWRDGLSYSLSLAFVGASVTDTCLTIHAINAHGLREANPFLGNLADNHHWTALWAIQGVGVGLAVWGCNALIRSDETLGRVAGWTLLVALTAFRWWCVGHNIGLIRGAR